MKKGTVKKGVTGKVKAPKAVKYPVKKTSPKKAVRKSPWKGMKSKSKQK